MSATQIKDASNRVVTVQSGESCDVVVTFHDNAGTAIAKASLLTLTATLYEESTADVINTRNAQSVLDANDGTVASNGTLTLRLGPSDAVIVGTVDVGDTERHVLRLTWTWNDGVAVRTGVDEWVLLVEKMASPA